jgi:pimeloyl-ACP methyl ester carboxylesterase
MRLTRCLMAAAAVAASLAAFSPASARIGVVMLHGNLASGLDFERMVPLFGQANYGLETPDMCWSARRQYDKTPLECMVEVDRAIVRLRQDGFDQIVIAGHSMGGINTLLYAANHPGVAGVIVFAPAEHQGRAETDPTVAFARDLVAKGQGDVPASFPTNGNPLRTIPRAWLGFFGPDSVLDDKSLLPRLTAPLFWAAGTDDNGQKNAVDRFRLAPPAPLNEFVLVKADHFATPNVAAQAMLSWLNQLQASLDKPQPTH